MIKRNGFTLIELAIVLVIVGIIASLLVPTLIEAVKRGKITEARSIMFAARDEIIGYALQKKQTNGKAALPTSLAPIGNPKDPWKQALDYRNATNLGTDICDASDTDDTLHTAQNETVQNIAFVLRSSGPDSTRNATLGKETNASQPGDDLLLYVTLPHLKALVCDPKKSSIIDWDPDSFFAVNKPGIPESVTINPGDGSTTTGTISLGFPNKPSGTSEYSYGCVWYQGNKGGCQQGNCTLGKGFRAYFTFTTKKVPGAGDLADGFTFAVISALANTKNSCGGMGSTLGYSATNGLGSNADQGVAPFVNPPKIGTEFDFYRSSAFADPNPDRDHIGLLYWGNHDPPGTPPYNDPNKYWGGDDNHHNPNVGNSGNPQPPAPHVLGSNHWFDETGTKVYPVRFEISRQDIKGSDSGNYTTRLWFNCQNCSDVTKDGQSLNITADTNLTDTITLDATWHDQMDKVMFGWTQGTGALTQDVTLTNASFYFVE